MLLLNFICHNFSKSLSLLVYLKLLPYWPHWLVCLLFFLFVLYELVLFITQLIKFVDQVFK
jgi:hypothetical protein